MNSSCDFCRRRKLRCTRHSPKCSQCLKFNRDCAYSPRSKRAPSAKAHINQLQERIIILEDTLRTFIGSKEDIQPLVSSSEKELECLESRQVESMVPEFSPGSGTSGESINAEDLLYDDIYNIDNLDYYEKDATSNEEWSPYSDFESPPINSGLIDGMGALSIGDNDENKIKSGHSFYGITSSNGLLRFLKKIETDNLPLKSDSQVHLINRSSDTYKKRMKYINSEYADIILNDESNRNEFILSFFEMFNNCYPFIKRKSFLRQLEQDKKIYTKENIRELTSIKDISFQILLNTILAIGALCKLGETSIIDLLYYRRVKAMLQSINIMEVGNYQLLEAYILLGNYVQRRNKPNTGWNYNGLSLRMAIGFGLHKETNSKGNNSTSSEVLERRRRLWWGLFFFDVGLTLTFGRPLHLPQLESIDIKYPSNVEDEELDSLKSGNSIETIHKKYPTKYAGLIQEARLSKLSYKIYGYITRVSGERSVTKINDIIELNKLISDFKNTLPEYFRENDEDVSKVLHSICPPNWFRVKLSGAIEIPKWFDLSRRRIIWRYKNIQILMFRSFIWESSSLFRDNTAETHFDQVLLDQCICDCYSAANDTISSIWQFVDNCEIDMLSSWYSTYFIFQAVLIPILLLYKTTNDGSVNKTTQWIKDIELTKTTLKRLIPFNNSASDLVETIDIISIPIIEKLKRMTPEVYSEEFVSVDASRYSDFEELHFNNLPSATINLFSNVGIDGERNFDFEIPNPSLQYLFTPDNYYQMGQDAFSDLISNNSEGKELQNGSQDEVVLVLDEYLHNNLLSEFLQRELFPNDSSYGNFE